MNETTDCFEFMEWTRGAPLSCSTALEDHTPNIYEIIKQTEREQDQYEELYFETLQ